MIHTKRYTTSAPSSVLFSEEPEEFDDNVDTCYCCDALWHRTNYWQGELYITFKQMYVLGFVVTEQLDEVRYVCGACKELMSDSNKTETHG